MISIEKEFLHFTHSICHTWGLDELSSKLFGILYLEPHEISIENLSKRTGYSLASISNKMRFLEEFGMAERLKKPGSKRVYYYLDKDYIKLTRKFFNKAYQTEILTIKKSIPALMDKFKKEKLNKHELEKFKIIESLYEQAIKIDEVYQDMIKNLNTLK